MTAKTESQTMWSLGSGPFIFAGVPPLLTGEVVLANHSDDRLKVKAIPTGDDGAKRAKPPIQTGDVQTRARLDPGSSLRVMAQIMIDPTTPPGTYETALRCGDQRESAVLHVFASNEVDLVPDPIEASGRAGETLSQVVVATNRGNVPHRVPTGIPIQLEELNWVGRSMIFALRDTRADEGHQRALDRLLHEFRTTLPGTARVRVKSRTKELTPGQRVELQVEIDLPSGLAKGRTYVASSPFVGSRLAFRIECTGGKIPEDRRAG